ncbi:MAG: EamA family transporter [Lachnospiraceae bacterium]|nr:EamA family transporter [Lachnospiraceae bacterium]
MEVWMWLVLLYAILKGVREIVKKKALTRSSVIEVLFFYTAIGFLFVLPEIPNALNMDLTLLPWVFAKSFIIFVSWLCGYAAISKMPISLYCVTDLARVLFATLLGIAVLGESFTFYQGVGLSLVMVGLVLVNLQKKGAKGRVEFKYVLMTLVSCLGNAVSGLMDKLIMRREISDGQLQFWYMLFLLVLYFGYLLWHTAKVEPVNLAALKKNYWIPILSVLFMIGDRALFIANGMADSRVTVMTLLKQSCVVVSIIGGFIVFKEKKIGYRLACAGIVVAGIAIATLGA